MKKRNLLILALMAVMFIACNRSNDPYAPDYGLFRMTAGIEGEADVVMGLHDIEFSFNGEPKNFMEVTLIGKFDSFSITEGTVPDWMTAVKSDNTIRMTVSKNDGPQARTALIGFTAYKGSKSQKGTIQIYQGIITLEDMKKKEDKAIRAYLKKFDVVDELPPLAEIEVGSVAPFYKLNPEGSVYMQLVRRGTSVPAVVGQKVSFRYFRYNLLSYLDNGKLPSPEGNLDSTDVPASTMVLGSEDSATLKYGLGIQLPLLLGLSSDCEVNLVVASSMGFPADSSTITPFLYNVRYYGPVADEVY